MTKKSKVDNAEETSHPEEQPSSSKPVAETPVQSSEGEDQIDREELISKARAFLASPQVRNEDIPAKRRFLSEKGLTDAEIDQLLRELVRKHLSSLIIVDANNR
jgi:predicted ABC-type transport system involved in lysophospholipase L1 biosynthesis ATPase subunit